jgi:hypothetical protein
VVDQDVTHLARGDRVEMPPILELRALTCKLEIQIVNQRCGL